MIKHTEVMKQALEALLINCGGNTEGKGKEAITALREALAKQPAQQDSTCSNALRIQGKAYPRTCKKCGLGPCVELAQQALDKMAENARELGLDYEPAQQEPVAWKLVPIEPTEEMLKAMDECSKEGYDERLYAGHAASVYMAAVDVAPSPPQRKEPEPVVWMYQDKSTHEVRFQKHMRDFVDHGATYETPLYTTPQAQRTWVGLTDEEVKAIFDSVPTASCQSYAHWRSLVALAIETKLREKNT